jgi:DNA mismatch endonuclease Vsr
MDKLSKVQREKNMKAVKNKGSNIELLLMKMLWQKGYRYRKNDPTVYGKPDIVFKRLKIAIFCDSEFWHGKNWELKKEEHKSNIEFWHKKIERNIQRDIEVNDYLTKNGWKVLRFWGYDIKKKLDLCICKIEETISERKSISSKYN